MLFRLCYLILIAYEFIVRYNPDLEITALFLAEIGDWENKSLGVLLTEFLVVLAAENAVEGDGPWI